MNTTEDILKLLLSEKDSARPQNRPYLKDCGVVNLGSVRLARGIPASAAATL